MNDIPVNPNNAMETRDSLEAAEVFRTWKNIFFAIVLICLLLIQAAFWVVDLGIVKPPETAASASPAASTTASDPAVPPGQVDVVEEDSPGGLLAGLDFNLLSRVIGVANGILIVSGILFAVTIFFSLMVSLVGRLNGVNDISRAFILTLIMVVLIIPWQRIFGSNVVGVAYGADELLRWLDAKSVGLPNLIFHYLRFTGLWLVVLLLLIMAQLRSRRWSTLIVERLHLLS